MKTAKDIARNITTLRRDPVILMHYLAWHASKKLGRDPAIDFGGGPVKGFKNFNSYLGAMRNRPTVNELRMVRHLCDSGQTIIDVGANYGAFSTLFARVATEAKIFSFEPVPITLKSLTMNLETCAVGRAEPIMSAVGKVVGEVRFTDSDDPATNSMSSSGEIVVPCTTLDHFAAERKIALVDFLKIDVEGAELDALIGASRLFDEKRVRTGMIEICPGILNSFGVDVGSIYEFLCDYRYELVDIETGDVLTATRLSDLPRTSLINAIFRRRPRDA